MRESFKTAPVKRLPSRSTVVPHLATGDHLNRLEFERRYNAMREANKAELLERVFYMPSVEGVRLVFPIGNETGSPGEPPHSLCVCKPANLEKWEQNLSPILNWSICHHGRRS